MPRALQSTVLVFEIGNSLREARLRQGFELPRVEADTKIRAKYLRALEEERFEVLPGETYVKGFLRTYSEYLGPRRPALRRRVQLPLHAGGGAAHASQAPPAGSPRARARWSPTSSSSPWPGSSPSRSSSSSRGSSARAGPRARLTGDPAGRQHAQRTRRARATQQEPVELRAPASDEEDQARALCRRW